MNKNLLIVSATRMARKDGQVFVFEPTLREVEKLTQIFDSITWIGVHDPQIPQLNGRTDETGKISFVILPMLGGAGWKNKLRLILLLPFQIFTIWKTMLRFQFIHTRAPSTPALIAIGLGKFMKGKRFWHKFAGNWVDPNPPFSYAIQKKWMLKFEHGRIAVNGKWDDMPSHIHAFENPCFSELELNAAIHQSEGKRFDEKINLLFVGRVEEEKGIGRIIRAIQTLPTDLQSQIGQLTIIGKGRDLEKLMKEAQDNLKVPYQFLGSLKRDALNLAYSESHVFCLPSNASEGFPKVIAEAAAFKNALLVSSVSSVAQYVHHQKHGFVCEQLSPEEIGNYLKSYLENRELLKNHAQAAMEIPQLFTYERYNHRVVTEIFPELGN